MKLLYELSQLCPLALCKDKGRLAGRLVFLSLDAAE